MTGRALTLSALVALVQARAIVTNNCPHQVYIWSVPRVGSSHTDNLPVKPGGRYEEPWRFGTDTTPGIAIKISTQADGINKGGGEINFAYSIDKHDKSKIWVDLSPVRGMAFENNLSFHTCHGTFQAADLPTRQCQATDDIELVLCGAARTTPTKDITPFEKVQECYDYHHVSGEPTHSLPQCTLDCVHESPQPSLACNKQPECHQLPASSHPTPIVLSTTMTHWSPYKPPVSTPKVQISSPKHRPQHNHTPLKPTTIKPQYVPFVPTSEEQYPAPKPTGGHGQPPKHTAEGYHVPSEHTQGHYAPPSASEHGTGHVHTHDHGHDSPPQPTLQGTYPHPPQYTAEGPHDEPPQLTGYPSLEPIRVEPHYPAPTKPLTKPHYLGPSEPLEDSQYAPPEHNMNRPHVPPANPSNEKPHYPHAPSPEHDSQQQYPPPMPQGPEPYLPPPGPKEKPQPPHMTTIGQLYAAPRETFEARNVACQKGFDCSKTAVQNHCMAKVVYPMRRGVLHKDRNNSSVPATPRNTVPLAIIMRHEAAKHEAGLAPLKTNSLCDLIRKHRPETADCDEETVKMRAREIYPELCEPQFTVPEVHCEQVKQELKRLYPGVDEVSKPRQAATFSTTTRRCILSRCSPAQPGVDCSEAEQRLEHEQGADVDWTTDSDVCSTFMMT